MKTPKQTCRTCKYAWFYYFSTHTPPRPLPGRYGDCLCPAPAMPVMPNGLYIRIGHAAIYPETTDCTFWAPKEAK